MAIGANLIIGNPSLMRGGGSVSNRIRTRLMDSASLGVILNLDPIPVVALDPLIIDADDPQINLCVSHHLTADLSDVDAGEWYVRIPQYLQSDMSDGEIDRYHVYPPITVRPEMLDTDGMAGAITIHRYLSPALVDNDFLAPMVKEPNFLAPIAMDDGDTLTITIVTRVITDPDAIRLIGAMVPEPSIERQGLIEDTIVGIKDAGAWDKLDILYLAAAHSQQAARLNWKNPNLFRLTPNISSMFQVDRGFKGDIQNNGELLTGWSRGVGEAWAETDAHLAVMVDEYTTPSRQAIGTQPTANFYIIPYHTTGKVLSRVNFGSNLFDATVTEGNGYTVSTIRGGNQAELYRDGVSLSAVAVPITAADLSDQLRLLEGPTIDITSDALLQAAHVGGALSDVEVTSLYAVLRNYINEVEGVTGPVMTAGTQPSGAGWDYVGFSTAAVGDEFGSLSPQTVPTVAGLFSYAEGEAFAGFMVYLSAPASTLTVGGEVINLAMADMVSDFNGLTQYTFNTPPMYFTGGQTYAISLA